ncbi:hypothetical protein [Amycolatopsis sp. cmx-8-4]|uniref:hypothetical protein n=1 Tax=Amycolatopsis sp. cmx-8-4 TaxID=2790947 RepID=UPI00397BF0F0
MPHWAFGTAIARPEPPGSQPAKTPVSGRSPILAEGSVIHSARDVEQRVEVLNPLLDVEVVPRTTHAPLTPATRAGDRADPRSGPAG